MRLSIAKKVKFKDDLLQSLESCRAEITCLEKELAEAKDVEGILELDLAEVEHVEADLFNQLELQDKNFTETEQEVLKAHNTSKESLRTSLITEFEQAYAEELSILEEQIRSYKLSIT